MPTTSLDTIRCSSLLAALAAPERLRIVRFLAAGPQNVSTIAKNLCIPNNNLSHHLATLTNANFLRREHRG
ncbi:ArsR/SmtB family transcription factor [Limnoglobus roseus]|uniref:ArsR family transcriptional regulator n=1 Tax=Limnoglobus roseus TaxID=2598579 RepID=A0A5C1AEB6_9BACT|nr:helix-turn-helix domain-containing protein [Limnoglobus roseus]QEL16366.1 ArsR family transcriptional regulator [Limnoglobus roseus]